MNTRRVFLLSGAALLAAPAALAHPRKAVYAAPKPAAKKKPGKPAGADDEDGGTDFASASGPPAQTPLGPVDTPAQWAFIIDFNTGAELLNKQADVQMPPSSMTKLMTAYIVYSKLKAGSLHLDQMLPVSEAAWRVQGSKMFVEINGTIKVEDLIRGMIIQSGNDACVVLAEGIAGTQEQFVELMNQEAKRLGLKNTHYMNCYGWPDPQHYMSARDIATLAKAMIKDFPEYYHYDSEKQFIYHGIVQYNRNPLVQRGLADGLKTGHTDAGGYGVVASAEHSGRARDRGAERHAEQRRARGGKHSHDGLGVRQFRKRDAVQRHRYCRQRAGLSRHAAKRAAGGRAGSGADHAARLARACQGSH